MFGQAIDLGERRTHDVVDYAPLAAQFIDIVQKSDLHHIAAILESSRHPARFHLEAGRVGDDGLLETDFRTVRKTGDHGGVLSPPLGKATLRGRITVWVLEPFDIT